MPAISPETSLSLLAAAREPGAELAWRRLVDIYTDVLHGWLRSARLQEADRNDITQRVLEVLFRRLDDFEHGGRTGSFRTWLRRITLNFLREFWRRRPMDGSDSILQQLVDPHSQLSRLWDEQHERHVLHALLEQVRPEFTDSTWQAFRRLALDGATARAVAVELGITANAVIIAKCRVLARLRFLAGDML